MKNLFFKNFKWLLVPLVFFTLGVGNAWGANQTYTLVSDVSTLTSSDKILIVAYNGSSYYALKNNQKTTADNLPATSVTISSNTITADLETDYTWYAEYKDNATISSTSYRRYYFKSTKGNWYLQNAGAVKSKIDSKNATDGQNIWVVGYTGVNSSYSVTGLWNQSASRMLTVRSSDFRAYGSANFNDIDGHTVYFYKKATSCDKSVGVTKGTATNGTVNTISSASVATCSSTASERRVTITITPAECYDAPSTLTWTKSSGTVSASKQSGPTDNGDGTYSYVYQFAQNDNGAGTFGVTCTAKDPGKTVNFDAGPGVSASSSLTETCDGSGVTLPAVTASGVCKGWTTFAGWATSAVSDSTTTSVTVYAAGSKYTPASDNMTLYAVYSKVKGGAGLTSVVGGNMSSSLPSGWSKSGAGQYSGNGVRFDDEGDWILSPDFSSQNLTKVTVKFKAGNNGSAGSVLRFEAIDKDGYEITGVDFSPTEAYDNQSTENSVVIDAGEKIYTIAVELTDKTSNVGMKYCEVFKSSSTTYYCSDPNCCTPLGSINGSFL